MKRFQFNLQAVLTLRQREEQNAMDAYAKELLGRQQALVRLAEVEAEIDRARTEWRQSAADGCSAFKLVQAQLSYAKLSDRRDLCARNLSEAERRTSACLDQLDRKSTRLNSSHTVISYAVFCLKKKTK